MPKQTSDTTNSSNTINGKRHTAYVSSALRSIALLLLVLSISSYIEYLLLKYFSFKCSFMLPTDDSNLRALSRIPRSIHEWKALAFALSSIQSSQPILLLIVYVSTYIYLQSFAIPGSIMLSVLGGYLFGFAGALFLVCLCSAVGACICFTLSRSFASSIINRQMFQRRLIQIKTAVNENRDNLMSFLLFLRITPILPNWLVNVGSPHVDIPLATFFVGTFIGVAPLSVIHIKAGCAIEQLKSTKDLSIFNGPILWIIGLLAIAVMLPVAVKRWGGRFFKLSDGGSAVKMAQHKRINTLEGLRPVCIEAKHK